MPRFLLTGTPGSGKTTLVCRLAELLQAAGIPVTGFAVHEVREQGRRAGFAAEAFGGPRALIAHVSWADGPWVGRYRVDVAAFERVALPAVGRAVPEGGVVVIDELGQMELFSDAFVCAIQRLFDHSGPLVATVHLRAHPITDALKQRHDVELVDVRPGNRDALLARLAASFGLGASPGPPGWSPEGSHRAP
jgi:nucleoside-triphosphatase